MLEFLFAGSKYETVKTGPIVTNPELIPVPPKRQINRNNPISYSTYSAPAGFVGNQFMVSENNLFLMEMGPSPVNFVANLNVYAISDNSKAINIVKLRSVPAPTQLDTSSGFGSSQNLKYTFFFDIGIKLGNVGANYTPKYMINAHLGGSAVQSAAFPVHIVSDNNFPSPDGSLVMAARRVYRRNAAGVYALVPEIPSAWAMIVSEDNQRILTFVHNAASNTVDGTTDVYSWKLDSNGVYKEESRFVINETVSFLNAYVTFNTTGTEIGYNWDLSTFVIQVNPHAVLVYERNNATGKYSQKQKITVSLPSAVVKWAGSSSIAMSRAGDVFVFGANNELAAPVYHLVDGTYVEVHRIPAPSSNHIGFGHKVRISPDGTYILVASVGSESGIWIGRLNYAQ